MKSWFIGRDHHAEKDWRQEEKGKTEDETVEWHHWLSGYEFEQALGDGEGQRFYHWLHGYSNRIEIFFVNFPWFYPHFPTQNNHFRDFFSVPSPYKCLLYEYYLSSYKRLSSSSNLCLQLSLCTQTSYNIIIQHKSFSILLFGK